MGRSARQLRALDWLLLASALPLWLVMVGFEVRHGLTTGFVGYRFGVNPAAGAEGFPSVERVLPTTRFDGPRLEVGDRIVRIGAAETRGDRVLQVAQRLTAEGAADRSVTLEVLRGTETLRTRLVPVPFRFWWARIVFEVGLVLCGLIALLRAPHWHLRRLFFVVAIAVATSLGGFNGLSGIPVLFEWSVLALATPISALVILVFWEITESARPLRPWQRAQAWLAVGVSAFSFLAGWVMPWGATFRLGLQLSRVLLPLIAISILVGVSRAYRRSSAVERRQIRWIVYGLYVGVLPFLLLQAAGSLGFDWWSGDAARMVMQLSLNAIPAGLLVSLLGYRFLDVDRLISATTSYTILGVILLGVALQVIPRVAEAASGAVGLPAAAGQWGLSLAFVALAVQAHRSLRPWIDRRLFAERVAVEQELATLAMQVGACRSVEELTRLTAERIDAILRPESVVVYAREGSAFTPVFVRGHSVPPAFPIPSPLVGTLEARAAPLAASSAALDPFDRAALATLGAEVVIPTRRAEQLSSFLCLGAKRTGDIYTPAELALLTAVSGAAAEVLRRMSDQALLAESRALQASLRRYVPGAIAERIESGRDLDATEREVTVLFVDIRGYSGFAEQRAAEAVFSSVNEHTERVSRVVRAHGGAVVEFNGDGMMAVFGAPEALAAKERCAVEAAREIVDGCPSDLAVGVGIATGPAFTGNIRAADRWIWSAIGDTTNLAARLQVLTRELHASIATDTPTRRAAGYVCADFAHHADVPLRGRSRRVDVFALPLASAAQGGRSTAAHPSG